MIESARTASSNTSRERREFWLFMLIALVILGAGIGLRDPWPSDEPRFALVAKQMVESGDWLFTHRGSELYSDKPPMFMQMQAAAYTLTGNWRVAFLLPSLLAALGTLFLIHDIGRRLWNHRTGLWAAAALLATLQFVYQSKRAQIDPVVTFLITLGNYGLLRHFLLGPDWRAYWLGCFAAGLGVITKGVGIITLLLFLPYVYARVRHWQPVLVPGRAGWRWAGGALAFLAAVAIWLVRGDCRAHTRAPSHAYMSGPPGRQQRGPTLIHGRSAAAMVFHRRDRVLVDAARVRHDRRAAALARTPESTRRAFPAAAGLGRARARVLHDSDRQARGLHPARAAVGRPDGGAIPR